MCAYQPNIPQPTDALSDSQSDILGNFQAIKTLIDVNHVTFDATNQGKHRCATFPQGTAPTTIAGEVALYGATGTGAVPQLWFAPASAGTPYCISQYIYNSGPKTGTTTLPSGIVIIWGQENLTGVATALFPFTGFSTTCFGVMFTPVDVGAADSNIAVILQSYNKTSYTVYCTARLSSTAKAVTFNYIAFGI